MNLFVFGDSFSTNYTNDLPVSIEDSWPALLSNKLNCTLKNYASAGMCNGEIINRFISHYHEIGNDDVVILETGFFSRLLNPFTNSTIFLNDISNKSDHKNMDSNTLEDYNFFLQYIHNLETYITHDILKFKFIIDFLKQKNVRFLLWSVDDDPRLEKYIFKSYAEHYVLYPDDWRMITSNPNHWAGNDRHFNKNAHKYVYERFYNKLLDMK